MSCVVWWCGVGVFAGACMYFLSELRWFLDFVVQGRVVIQRDVRRGFVWDGQGIWGDIVGACFWVLEGFMWLQLGVVC